jgi:hypothetical protein
LENLKRGLVLWLKLDEGSGTTAADSSGKGNSGTLVNGPTWVDGKLGKALSFDGVDDYVTTGNDAGLGNTNRITISLWFYANNISGLNRNLVSKNPGFQFSIFSNGQVQNSIHNGTQWYEFNGATITTNNWYYLTMTWDGIACTHKIYINGALTNTFSGACNNMATGGSIRIGSDFGEHVNGTIDEVRIYNRALTAEEIQALYYEGLTNRFNVTFLLLNKGSANLGFNFSAALFLQNKTVINKRFDLNSSFRAAATEEVELNFDDYYPGYADIEKLKVCSIACPGVCAEIKETMC